MAGCGDDQGSRGRQLSSRRRSPHATIDQLTAAVAALRRPAQSPPAGASEDTPVEDLTTAAARGDLSAVEEIVSAGVNVNQPNKFGRTALQVMRMCRADIAEVLLQAGADPNIQDMSSRGNENTLLTPAHDVAREGFIDTLQCLLRFGADITLQDAWGNTAAHLAAKEGCHHVVQYLVQGMNVTSLVNNDGRTALDYNGAAHQSRWNNQLKDNPCSLKQLSRVAVRRAMGRRRLSAIQRLPMPLDLKDYIMLQDSAHNQNHPRQH